MKPAPAENLKRDTAARFGCLWENANDASVYATWHYERVRKLLPPHSLSGWTLDAGCGHGRDAAHLASLAAGRVLAVDISEEGVRRVARRARLHRLKVSALRADVERLPLRDDAFDFVYSYGVLHHLPHPEQGFRELARVVRPGGKLAVYVYEDFAERSAMERFALRQVTRIRRRTIRMPRQQLYQWCRFASPLAFLAFTVPHRALARARLTRPLSERVPFRHGTSLTSLAGDLYDRFAAPIEFRCSCAEVQRWFQDAGFHDIGVLRSRGWVGYGTRSSERFSVTCASGSSAMSD